MSVMNRMTRAIRSALYVRCGAIVTESLSSGNWPRSDTRCRRPASTVRLQFGRRRYKPLFRFETPARAGRPPTTRARRDRRPGCLRYVITTS